MYMPIRSRSPLKSSAAGNGGQSGSSLSESSSPVEIMAKKSVCPLAFSAARLEARLSAKSTLWKKRARCSDGSFAMNESNAPARTRFSSTRLLMTGGVFLPSGPAASAEADIRRIVKSMKPL